MALASAPGGENPSAAFLAGAQHGASLATQHAAKPPAKPKPAASPQKPAKPSKASPPAQTLLQQAQQIAAQQTNAMIQAIQQQQALYSQQGLDKASQINSATQAAAQLLKDWNLGGTTADSYNQAAQTIGGLAQGFSGQTGTDARSAAAQVAANLANLGSPTDAAKTSTGQTSNPDALQNVLYGLGGFIPGNLLETQGQAQAAVQRALPASLLGYGQNQAAGAVQAGQQQADTLIPQIVDAQGKLPTLVQQALSGLSAQQQQAFTNKLNVAKFNAAQSSTAFNQKATVARLNQEAQNAATAQFNSDRSYSIRLKELGLATKRVQIQALAQEYKFQNGGLTPAAVTRARTDAAFVISQAKTAKATPDYQTVMQEMLARHVPISLAQTAIRAWNPVLKGTPATGIILKDYNQTVGASTQQLAQSQPFIIREATRRGLDPAAVIAVSQMEGAGGGVGDNGTSFGPWQLHIGGALPKDVAAKGAAYAAQWAWTPAGIRYALDQMTKIAKGLKGATAVNAIVTRFERPAKPSAEVAGAIGKYVPLG